MPPSPVAVTPASPAGSYVLGDSLILSAGVKPALESMGYTVKGTVGVGVSEGYLSENLLSLEAQSAPTWVIELGTNNSGDPGTVSTIESWVDTVNSLRNPAAPQVVYWVLPYRPPSYHGTKQGYNLDAFDAEIIRLSFERDWLVPLDFAGMAALNPQWFDADTAMHIHPNAEGQAVLLQLIAG